MTTDEGCKVTQQDAVTELSRSSDAKRTLLKPGVKRAWLVSFLAASFLTIASFVFINSAQTYILADLLKWPHRALGSVQGNLSSADELVSLVMTVVWGVVSDRIGRQPVFASGFLLMALATFLYPLAGSVYGETGSGGSGIEDGTSDPMGGSSIAISSFLSSLLFFRIIFACGGSAAADMLTVVLGDYAAEGMRSRLAGWMGFVTGLGACFSALVLTRMPTFFTRVQGHALLTPAGTVYVCFWTTGALLLIGAAIAGWGVRRPPGKETAEPAALADRTTVSKCWWKRMTTGFREMRDRPILLLAYLGGFVARGDSIILTVFAPSWIVSFYARNGLCAIESPTTAPVSPLVYVTQCPEAKKLVSTLMTVSNMCALLGAPVVGHLASRLGVRGALALPALLGIGAYVGLLFAGDPRSRVVVLLAALQGFAQIGMIIASMALVAAEAPAHSRGAISGVYSLFGALGIIVVSKTGGWLVERWRETAPFAVIAAANVVLLIAVLLVPARRV